MFRDSRGVVHTVSSSDPLADLPPEAATALQEVLLQGGDLGTRLEQCEAVRDLLDDWQTAFFEGLPDEVDLAEESRVAAEAGLSLEQVEAESAADAVLALESLADLDEEQDGLPYDLPYEDVPLDDPRHPLELSLDDSEDPRDRLPEDLVGLLERSLLLLPLRVRLEALIAASQLVDEWEQLLADHEKLLGHLVLAHGGAPEPHGHDELAERHAALHATTGPGH